jgi:putative addiction module component (TIGR02574 family)
METKLEMLAAEAMKLSASERAAFAQLLLASLEQDTDIDDAWAEEVERRSAALDAGIEQAIPMEEALAQIRAELK